MAFRTNLIHNRRHALPGHFLIDLVRPAHGAFESCAAYGAAKRPRLIASWRVGADGDLACTWSAAPDDPASKQPQGGRRLAAVRAQACAPLARLPSCLQIVRT